MNTPGAFLSHRLPIAIAAKDSGFDVHVVSSEGEEIDSIQNNGLTYHVLPMSRSGKNLFNELVTLAKLTFLFIKIRPDLVHLVTLKPILYGGLVARITGVKVLIAAVAGLGSTFLASSLLEYIRYFLIKNAIVWILESTKSSVIFQNNDDKETLLSNKLDRLKVYLIPGSGVKLREFPYLPEKTDNLVITMPARLIRDKGVIEFAGAAKILFHRGHQLEFRLLGVPDPANPRSLTTEELERIERDGFVKLLGFQKETARLYAESNIICLPSYREGMPKALLEAAACGRAVVTTDVPGCRHAIIENKTGILVPARNAVALADAIEKLVQDDKLRFKMGRLGRKLAEEKFSIENVVQKHMKIYSNAIKDMH